MSDRQWNPSIDEPVAISEWSDVVWVSGRDSVSFLDGLLSQNIEGIEPGSTARSLLLAPNGKLRAPLIVLRGDDRIGLICDRGHRGSVAGDLSRFKIRVDVAIEEEQRAVYEIWGGSPGPDSNWTADTSVVKANLRFRHSPVARSLLIGEKPDQPVVGPGAVAAFRIRAGEPVMGVDLTDRTIPQEGVDVAASVDFTKGCYLGQELVARIDSRGHVNQRLMGVVGRPGTLRPGGELQHDERAVGSLTSAATDLEEDIGLAMVRKEVAANSEVQVGDQVAMVVDLPIV